MLFQVFGKSTKFRMKVKEPGLYWVSAFISAVLQCTIAGTISHWYFSRASQPQGVSTERQRHQNESTFRIWSTCGEEFEAFGDVQFWLFGPGVSHPSSLSDGSVPTVASLSHQCEQQGECRSIVDALIVVDCQGHHLMLALHSILLPVHRSVYQPLRFHLYG